MSDNLRRYRAIHAALKQAYGTELKGNVARHVATLAALISGIVGSKSVQLPHIARKVPSGTQPESRVKRYYRWITNETIEEALYFLPFAQALLEQLALETLVLVIDGSVVGRGCVALMVNVIYKGRSLPIAWTVVSGKKGHFAEDVHIALIEKVHGLVPSKAHVVVLGDGEFDGIRWQQTLQDYGWTYVCRTGRNITLVWDAETLSCAQLEAHLTPGYYIALPEVLFTHERYGPVMLICQWDTGCQEPIYLVSNMASAEQACDFYRKRFRIETFFSDQKSRGFNLHKSHISKPERLSRLLIAACLAYLWIVYLGALCLRDGWKAIIHRRSRCDLSLFQLGLQLLDHVLNEGLRIPVAFQMLT
jgi:hypothetical protein